MPTSVAPPLPPAGAFVKSPVPPPVVEPPLPPVAPVVPEPDVPPVVLPVVPVVPLPPVVPVVPVPPVVPVAPVLVSPVVPSRPPPLVLPPPPCERAAVRCAGVSRAPQAVVAIAPRARTAARRSATGLREGIAGSPSSRELGE